MNTDRFNRQLHEESQAKEKTLAKQIADKSGGKYTAAEVEDQMRIMGGLLGDSRESGAPATLIGQLPSDSGAQWQYAGKTDDGKPILTQIIAQPNQELQSYILANAGSVPGGDVPNIVYDPTGKKGFSVDVTGPFTKFDQSDADYVRDTTAGAASMISTNAGRISAAATTAAAFPTPYAAVYEAIAFGSTATGMAADAVVQLVRPNVGLYIQNSSTTLASNAATIKWPFASYAINETANTVNNSNWGAAAQGYINGAWNRFVNPPEKSK